MHAQAKKFIEKRINQLIKDYDFEKRKKTNPDECVCYEQNKKCHNLEELNCFFCYCPNYDTSVKEGGCKINSPKGKYIDNHEGKIWDCSDCDIMHNKENIRKYLSNRLYNI